MEKNISEVIESREVSTEDLFECLEMIKKDGNVVVIKFDGERQENQYTAFITFPTSRKKEMIRADESSMKNAILKILKSYIHA